MVPREWSMQDGVLSLCVLISTLPVSAVAMRGRYSCPPERPQWIGATEADNIAAEFTAFAMAQDIVLRLLPQRPTVIRPDLMLSQMIATFDSITTASPRLAQICRVLSTWLGPQVVVKQISAHKGHPWNELADALLPGRFHGFTNWQPPFMICRPVCLGGELWIHQTLP